MFKVKDRHGLDYCLAPTHEEWITRCVADCLKSYKELPVVLYQVGSKFRDELKAENGLLRSREFIMKDMYSFDASSDQAGITYEAVLKCYQRIFLRLGLTNVKVWL